MKRLISLAVLLTFPVFAENATESRVRGWVDTLHEFGLNNGPYPGIRQSATKSGQLATKWLHQEFMNVGIATVHREAFPMKTWEPKTATLELRIDSETSWLSDCWPQWFTEFTEGTATGPLRVWDKSAPLESFKGAIVLLLLEQTTREHIRKHTFDMSGYHELAKSRAAAVILGFPDFGNDQVFMKTTAVDADAFTGRMGALPAVSVEEESFKNLVDYTQSGNRTARVTLTGRAPVARGYNVVATLPGKTENVILFSAHSDGGAVEGGSGVAMLLELAKQYADLTDSGQPLDHTLVFLAHGGHYMGEMGLDNFIKRHDDQYAGRMQLHCRLGYAGKETTSTDFTARVDLLINQTMSHPERNRMKAIGKQLRMSATYTPTDGTAYVLKKVPVLNIRSSYRYGQTTADTPDKVDVDAAVEQIDLIKNVIKMMEEK
jgi:hypothetical protein